MGLIRSGAVVTIATVLFLSLFLGNAFLTLDWSLEYENVQPQVTEFATQMIEDLGVRQQLENNYALMEVYCGSYSSFVYTGDDFTLDIPCETINLGPDAVINYGVEEVVGNFYYKEYNCSLFKCLKEDSEPFVLVSKHAKDYWNAKFKLALLISIILIVVLFLVVESKHSTLTLTGILMVVAAFPFRKLNWAINLLPDSNFTDLILAFFTKSYNVFLIMTIIGACLFAIGIAFEFLGLGLKFSKFIGIFKKKSSEDKGKKGEASLTEPVGETFTKQEVAEIVREELEKDKKKKKLRKKVRASISKEKSKEDLGLSI